jgi:hypothetical protein
MERMMTGPEKYSFVYYEGTVIPQGLPHFLLEETSVRRVSTV